VSAFGAETLSEFEFLAGLSSERKFAKGFGGGEVRCGIELRSGEAEDSALESDGFGEQTGDVEGDSVGSGGSTAASPNRPSSEDDRRRKVGNLGLPPCFFVASELSHLGEVIAELWVTAFELRQEFVSDSVAGVGELTVGGVFSPELVAGAEEGLDLVTAGLKHGAKDRTLGE